MRSSTTATSEPLGTEGCQSLAVDEPWLVHVRQRRAHRLVEALDVADLHDHAFLSRELQQRVGLLERGCDRLLDEDVLAPLDRGTGDGTMRGRRHDDYYRVGRL